jgi:hypothetical protein
MEVGPLSSRCRVSGFAGSGFSWRIRITDGKLGRQAAAPLLLDDVRKFMRPCAITAHRIGLAGAKYDVLAHRIGKCAHRIGRTRSLRIVVNSYPAEAMTERRLESLAQPGIERPSRRSENVMNDLRRESSPPRILCRSSLPVM